LTEDEDKNARLHAMKRMGEAAYYGPLRAMSDKELVELGCTLSSKLDGDEWREWAEKKKELEFEERIMPLVEEAVKKKLAELKFEEWRKAHSSFGELMARAAKERRRRPRSRLGGESEE
jgi:uncharacterized protein with von Willebrand factor type A (vWA) domain